MHIGGCDFQRDERFFLYICVRKPFLFFIFRTLLHPHLYIFSIAFALAILSYSLFFYILLPSIWVWNTFLFLFLFLFFQVFNFCVVFGMFFFLFYIKSPCHTNRPNSVTETSPIVQAHCVQCGHAGQSKGHDDEPTGSNDPNSPDPSRKQQPRRPSKTLPSQTHLLEPEARW
jgi:hypothetical protein